MKLNRVDYKTYAQQEKLCVRLPLTQSHIFGGSHYFMIMNNNTAIGLCILNQHQLLKGLVQAVTLDRGPVWFDGYNSDENNARFADVLNDLYPNRIGRKRRWIPESAHEPDKQWARKGAGYKTAWLDITQSHDVMRANLKKNWRGALKKAENSDISVLWGDDLSALPFILKTYALDKKRRGYGGLNVYDLETYIRRWHDMGTLMIGRAIKNDNTIAYNLIITHGDSATYQCGWTHTIGRENNAHHFLLWRAVHMLQIRGVKFFDLGGINNENSGLAKFKLGMGSDLHCGAGLYT